MQLSGLHRRNHAPTFVNHTPRKITVQDFSQSGPEMLGPTGMAISAGPLYVNAIMGQAPSAAERDYARKASSTILREDSIHVEESENLPTPDSFSIHHDCTSQAPYSTSQDDEMITQASLLHLPKDNPSHDLAFFLQTTGPTAPHRRPSKIEGPRHGKHAPKNALRFLGVKRKGATAPPAPKFHEHDELRDEGGLLHAPKGAEQKFSSTGKRYFALQVDSEKTAPDLTCAEHTSSPSILSSRVSISIADAINSPLFEAFETWQNASVKDKPRGRSPTPSRTSPVSPLTDDELTIRAVDRFPSLVRPAASSPPSLEPASAVSMAESYQVDLSEHPAKRSFDVARALSSHPVRAITSPNLQLPKAPTEKEDSSRKYVSGDKEFEIKHPSPRRFASQPLLLQRASSIASSLYPRSGASDSPGPPPPRSPLRLRRDPRTIESILSPETDRKPTPKVAPPIKDVNEQDMTIRPIKPTVITDCTGPIKRPKSRGKNQVVHPAYPASRKQREERTRARKLRDRPPPAETVDAEVHAPPPPPPPPTSRQRLKKARPQIQTSDLRPAPLATRASSTASSNASWKKITEYTRTPVSAVPSENTLISMGETTGYTPISPTASNGSQSKEARMALSPVMLVAEEIPVHKTKSPPKPARVMMKDGKSYAPRPRSASIPRNAAKRRSRQGMQTPSRPNSPNGQQPKDEPPPLPSPPPNRALPPTPPASGSEKAERHKQTHANEANKELPVLPAYEIIPKTLPKRSNAVSHIASQVQRKSAASEESAQVHARLEALEKQNALLSAALTAVLRTNGDSNNALGPAGAEAARIPTAWENRIARRSAASHGASSSNGSALDMYMSTRRGH